MDFAFPKIYPILDASVIPVTGRSEFLHRLGSSLAEAGLTLLEYRNKIGSDADILSDAAVLRNALPSGKIKLILDDRPDLVDSCGFDGVHVDAGDLTPAQARRVLGPSRIIGTFGGGEQLVPGILDAPVDYFAIGPVFDTRTKLTDRRPIGLEGVRRLRDHSGPHVILSAAAGITLATAQAVLDAGASMVAVAEAIFKNSSPAGEFRRWAAELR